MLAYNRRAYSAIRLEIVIIIYYSYGYLMHISIYTHIYTQYYRAASNALGEKRMLYLPL